MQQTQAAKPNKNPKTLTILLLTTQYCNYYPCYWSKKYKASLSSTYFR